MSDATLQAIHDAIAAHIQDVNDESPEYLTEWVLVAAAVISDDIEGMSCYRFAPMTAYHSQLGLLYRGLEMLTGDED